LATAIEKILDTSAGMQPGMRRIPELRAKIVEKILDPMLSSVRGVGIPRVGNDDEQATVLSSSRDIRISTGAHVIQQLMESLYKVPDETVFRCFYFLRVW
jgi:hypothetical protein